jgi:hypothetical protein
LEGEELLDWIAYGVGLGSFELYVFIIIEGLRYVWVGLWDDTPD